MPYIKQWERDMIDDILFLPWHIEPPLTSGQLNYLITKVLLETKPKRYADYNNLIGVLTCVQLELYRRAVVPYEQEKCKLNGDVYE